MVKLDLSFEILPGFYERIAGRSGLANFNGVIAFSGTIGASYWGIVCVVLFNLSDNEYFVKTDSRIAQMIIEKYFKVKFVEYAELSVPNVQ